MYARTRRLSTTRLAALALTASAAGLGTVVAAGCGQATQSAKSRYLAKANAVCRDQSDAIRRVPAPAIDVARATSRKLKAMAAYFDQAVPIVKAHFKQLRALPPPPGDAAVIQRLLASTRELVDLLGALGRQARAGDVVAFRADLRAAGRASSNSRALAMQYGLVACAR
jgi:hypothetical protein